MKIVPALLAEKFETFLARLRQAETFADYVQIDLMDGLFVPTKSFPIEQLSGLETSVPFELHLMVNDPPAYLNGIEHPLLKQVIFHFEAKTSDPVDFIRLLKQKVCARRALAVKPDTTIEQFRKPRNTPTRLSFSPLIRGATEAPSSLRSSIRSRKPETSFPGKTIAVDGGVSLDNLNDFLKIGIDYVCIGSRIFVKGEPKKNYQQFVKKLQDLERKEVRY